MRREGLSSPMIEHGAERQVDSLEKSTLREVFDILSSDAANDLKSIVEDLDYSVITRLDDDAGMALTAEAANALYSEIFKGESLDSNQVRQTLRVAQMGFLTDESIMRVMRGASIDVQLSSLRYLKEKGDVDQGLLEINIGFVLRYRLEQDKLRSAEVTDVEELLRRYRATTPEVQDYIDEIERLRQDFADGKIVQLYKDREPATIDGCLGGVLQLPFADVIMPNFGPLRRGDGREVADWFETRGADSARMYQRAHDDRYFVISGAGYEAQQKPEVVARALRHEIQHVLNRVRKPELASKTTRDRESNTFEQQRRHEELFLIDELAAWAVQGGLTGIDQSNYFGTSIRRLEEKLEQSSAQNQVQFNEFKKRWEDVFYLLRILDDEGQSSRATQKAVQYVAESSNTVDELVKHLEVLIGVTYARAA